VLELEKDLRRWLENLPVQARPASRLYKVRKFVRRHRLGVAAATLGTLALLTATGAAIYGYVRAEEAREEAQMAAEFQVKQMQGIDPAAMGAGLRSTFAEVIRTQGIAAGMDEAAMSENLRQFEASTRGVNFTDVTLRQLNDYNLKPALKTIDEDYKDQPLLQARLWQSIAEIYSALGKNKDALAPQQRALDARRKLLGRGHRLTIESLIERSKLRNRMKEFALGEADLRAALALARRNLGEDDPLTIAAASGLASTLGENSRYDEAEALQRKVLESQTKTLGRDHPDTAASINSLAWILFSAGKARDALPYAEESLRLQRDVVKNDRDLSMALNTLAMTYRDLQRIEESEKLSREMLETDRRRLGSAHPTTLIDMSNLSMVLMDQGKNAEAESLLLQAIDAARTEFVESDPLFAVLKGTLSTSLFNQGRLVEAEAALVDVIAVRKNKYSEDHAETVFARADMTRVLMQQGRHKEAAQTLMNVLKWCQTNYGADSPTAAMVMQDLAKALMQEKEYDRAAALLGQALNIQRRSAGEADDRTLSVIVDIAVLQKELGDLEAAEALLRKVVVIQRRQTSKEDQARGALLSTIEPWVEALRARGKLDEAAIEGQEMVEAASRSYDPKHYRIGVYRTSHARTLTALRRFDEAERMLDGARANLAQGYNPNPEPVLELAQAYVTLYDAWNADRPDANLKAKADAWRIKLDAVNKAGAGRAAGLLAGG
jgi:tetratricopeptide (TPR) repeat protein